MKKLYFYLFVTFLIFFSFNLKSFASDGPTGSVSGVQYNYHLPTVIYWSITPSGFGWNGTLREEAYTRNREDGLCFIYESQFQTRVVSVDYLLNGPRDPYPGYTYLSKSDYVGSDSEGDPDFSKDPTQNPPGHWAPAGGYYANSFLINHPSDYQITFSDGPRFESLEDARNYITTGDRDGLISGGDSLDELAPINWGENDPSRGSNPDVENIPEPKFEVIKDSTGNHSIKFTNQIYNYSDHGVYGLVMKASWDSYGSYNMTWTSNFSNQFKVFVDYPSLLMDDVNFVVYPVPYNQGSLNRCPATINFETLDASVNSFNGFLNRNPVSDRTITFTNGNTDNNNQAALKFKAYLSDISCPYNTVVFSCFYYREMSDGTYHYGPTSVASISVPSQGAIYTVGGGISDPDPGIVDPKPIIIPGPTPGPNPDPIVNPGNTDPSDLYDNMQGLLGFIGQVPQLVGQLFTFLPQWLIIFIASAIGLMIVIGVVKLFLG